MVKPKSELDLLREQLTGAQFDLLMYGKHQGESPVIDANIRHKREQVEALQAKVLALEEEEKKLHSGLLEEWAMDDKLYSLALMEKISVYTRRFLELRRRDLGIDWRQTGYTLDECKKILGESVKPANKINPRAYKALELWAKLKAMEE